MMKKDKVSDEALIEFFKLKNIAVIGISRYTYKAAHAVPQYLQSQGYNIIPVNPSADAILGKKSYASILDVDEPVDIAEIFRPSHEVVPFVEDAIKIKPKLIWLQLGIYHPRAVKLAEEADIPLVFDRCMWPEHKRLMR